MPDSKLSFYNHSCDISCNKSITVLKWLGNSEIFLHPLYRPRLCGRDFWRALTDRRIENYSFPKHTWKANPRFSVFLGRPNCSHDFHPDYGHCHIQCMFVKLLAQVLCTRFTKYFRKSTYVNIYLCHIDFMAVTCKSDVAPLSPLCGEPAWNGLQNGRLLTSWFERSHDQFERGRPRSLVQWLRTVTTCVTLWQQSSRRTSYRTLGAPDPDSWILGSVTPVFSQAASREGCMRIGLPDGNGNHNDSGMCQCHWLSHVSEHTLCAHRLIDTTLQTTNCWQ